MDATQNSKNPSARNALYVGMAATALVAACNHDRITPTGVAARPALHSQIVPPRVTGSSRRRPSEDGIVRLANEIPGFAGMYLANHQLYAWIRDTTANHGGSAAASAALNAHMNSDGFHLPTRDRPSSIKVLHATYDFHTLSDYRDLISDNLLGVDGVYLVNLDQQINRVTVEILHSNALGRQTLSSFLQAHGIPSDAVNVVIGAGTRVASTSARHLSPRFTMDSLSDHAPTYMAGGIGFFDLEKAGNCTLGVVVDSSGTKEFVSASHCTSTLFGLDNDTTSTLGRTYIGREIKDPQGTYTCPNSCWYYRSSDAALFNTAGGYSMKMGVIARTTSRDSSALGSTYTFNKVINSSSPWLFITDTVPASSLVIGQEVDHMGITTGWQHGWVSATCNDYAETSSAHIYCMGEAGFIAEEGDSGGPVFFWDGYDGAQLAGIATAIDCGPWPTNPYCDSGKVQGSRILFSTWSGVLADLGSLNPLNNTTVGSLSLSGSVSGGNAGVSWSAVSTTNTSATTQYQVWQWTWDASTGTWNQNDVYIGSTTGLSYTDVSAPWTISSVAGASQPDQCTYSSVAITVRAYNQGAYSWGSQIWFQGPANGPGGHAC